MRQDSHLPEYKQSSMPREVNHPFKASVTLAIVSTSPLRLKAKLVDVQQWGDRSAEKYEYVLEWVNDQ